MIPDFVAAKPYVADSDEDSSDSDPGVTIAHKKFCEADVAKLLGDRLKGKKGKGDGPDDSDDGAGGDDGSVPLPDPVLVVVDPPLEPPPVAADVAGEPDGALFAPPPAHVALPPDPGQMLDNIPIGNIGF